jgi:hypothetical protein
VVGGLNYRYALRGDGQPVTELIAPEQQNKALQALLRTLSPATLMLPENVLQKLPPRPIGYTRHRELIKIRTDLTFDALGAAEAAADMTVSLLLHPARAGRLVEYHARDAKQPGLAFVIDRLIDATFKAGNKTGMEGTIQITVNDVVLDNLIKLALNKDASAQVKAVAYLKTEQLRLWLAERMKVTTNEEWKAHYSYALAQIRKFQQNPDEYRQDNLLAPPPGQPIGLDDTCGN